jgi:hypothetical protein
VTRQGTVAQLLRDRLDQEEATFSTNERLRVHQQNRYAVPQLLARSLHSACYERNPGFVAYLQRSGLPFPTHPHSTRADLDARQELYGRLAEEVWSPDRLQLRSAARPSAAA